VAAIAPEADRERLPVRGELRFDAFREAISAEIDERGHCLLRIKRPDGDEERRVMFYDRLPTPGSRLHLAGEPIEITSAGFFSTRFVVVAKPLS
jgi:hypothetical protein